MDINLFDFTGSVGRLELNTKRLGEDKYWGIRDGYFSRRTDSVVSCNYVRMQFVWNFRLILEKFVIGFSATSLRGK